MKPIFRSQNLVLTGVLLATIGLARPAHAQLIANARVADLNPGIAGSYPTNLCAYSSNLYFSASTSLVGRELWGYDGTNVVLVTNLNDQVTDLGGGVLVAHDSSPDWLTVFNDMLFFSAYDERRGAELWSFNGTNATRAADINPDANDTIKSSPNNSFPNQLTTLGSELFFSADGGGSKPNYELWKYDGVAATQVANIHPNSGSDFSSYPSGLTVFNGTLYFMADDGLNGYELWQSTGTGAALLTNIYSGNASSSSFPQYFTPFNNQLCFSAFTAANGFELWKTDGTNTSLVTDLMPGSNSSYPENLTVFSNALYFRAADGTNGSELWKYDGTSATLVSNINLAGDSFPKNLTVFQNRLFFAADDGIHGWELWTHDGTTASLVTDLNLGGDSFPEHLMVFNGALYFVATTPDTGYELWQCDGTNATLTADMNPGGGSSFPQRLRVFNNQLCFSATEDGFSNYELWAVWFAPFRISAIENLGADIRLTWATLGGRTNLIQSSDTVNGMFTNLSNPFVIEGVGEVTTNYTDAGGTTSAPSRFYRIVQP